MNTLEKQKNELEKLMKLANEAVELIKEFRDITIVLSGLVLNEITIEEHGLTIKVDDDFEGVRDYFIEEISSVVESEMSGWSSSLYEAIRCSEETYEEMFKSNKYTKEEFINYVGSIKYAEFRCEDIYKRLQQIEKEAADLEIDYDILENEE